MLHADRGQSGSRTFSGGQGAGFDGNDSFGHGGTQVVPVALGAGVVVAVGMAIMNLVMMEAVLEVVGATMIWAVVTITLHLLDP